MESKYAQRNRNVAKARGIAWKKKLLTGKLDTESNPSLLKKFRISRGISQDEASKDLGISLATYGAVERGIRPIKKHLAKFIADYFNLKLDSIFFEFETKFYAKKEK